MLAKCKKQALVTFCSPFMLLLLWIDEKKRKKKPRQSQAHSLKNGKKLSRLFFKLQKIFYNQSAWKNEMRERERKKRAFICLLHRVTCAFLCNFLHFFLLLSDSINSQELLFSYQLYCQHSNVYECVFYIFFYLSSSKLQTGHAKILRWWNLGILYNEININRLISGSNF